MKIRVQFDHTQSNAINHFIANVFRTQPEDQILLKFQQQNHQFVLKLRTRDYGSESALCYGHLYELYSLALELGFMDVRSFLLGSLDDSEADQKAQVMLSRLDDKYADIYLSKIFLPKMKKFLMEDDISNYLKIDKEIISCRAFSGKLKDRINFSVSAKRAQTLHTFFQRWCATNFCHYIEDQLPQYFSKKSTMTQAKENLYINVIDNLKAQVDELQQKVVSLEKKVSRLEISKSQDTKASGSQRGDFQMFRNSGFTPT